MNFHFQNKSMKLLNNQKGSLLILVLFALVLLSLLAFSVGHTVQQKLNVVMRLEARENLRLAAGAAVKQASVLLSESGGGGSYQSLNQSWSNNEVLWKKATIGNSQYSITASGTPGDSEAIYGLTDEDRKINLNTAAPGPLQKLFEVAASVEREEARCIVAAIRDWIDEDEDLNDGGAESKDYSNRKPPYGSKNAIFNDLQELRWVQGITPEIFSKVAPYLTLDGSRVNVNTATQTVLTAMGLNSNIASKIISYRKGKDGKEGTADDGVFKDLAEISDVLSRSIFLNEADKQNLDSVFAAGFSVNSTFFNAAVDAQVNQRQKIKVNAVLDSAGRVHRWHEEFF